MGHHPFTHFILISSCFFTGAVLLLTDCTEGGQTGDEDGVPGTSPWIESPPGGSLGESAVCGMDNDAELFTVDEFTPLGFTASEILAFAEDSFEAEVCWNNSFNEHDCDDLSERGLSCESKTTPMIDDEMVTLQIEYDGGEIRYYEPLGLDFCSGIVEIDVRIRLRTKGGGFDEQVDAILSAQSPYEAELSLRFWVKELKDQVKERFAYDYHELPVIAQTVNVLQGDLAVCAEDSEDIVLDLVDVELSVSELGLRGNMSAYLSDRKDERYRIDDLAVLGKHCREGCFAVEPKQLVLGDDISARSVIDLLNDIGEIEASNVSAEPVNLAFDFEYIDDSACVDMGVEWVGQPWEGNSLSFNAMMSIASEGLIDAQWTVNVAVETDGLGDINSIRIIFDPRFDPELKTTKSRWGLLGIDLAAIDRVSIYLDLELTPFERKAEIESTGEITIVVSDKDLDSTTEWKPDFEGIDAGGEEVPDAGADDRFESETILLRLLVG